MSKNIVRIKVSVDKVLLSPPTCVSMHTACNHPVDCFLQHPKILFYSYVLEYFVLVHMRTHIHTSTHASLCKLKFSFLSVSSFSKTIKPSHWSFPFILTVSYADHLFKLLYSSIWERGFIFSCRIYWKILKSLLWILLILVSWCRGRPGEYAKRTRKQ